MRPTPAAPLRAALGLARARLILCHWLWDWVASLSGIFEPERLHLTDIGDGFYLRLSVRHATLKFRNTRDPVAIFVNVQSDGIRSILLGLCCWVTFDHIRAWLSRRELECA